MPIKRTFNRTDTSFANLQSSRFAKPRKTPRHEEDDLQEACVKLFALTYPTLANLLHHSPNGGKRNAREAAKFKRMGVRAGYPDLSLHIPRGGYHGLFIELKSAKGAQSDNQREQQRLLEAQGYRYEVVRSVEEFSAQIKDYLE